MVRELDKTQLLVIASKVREASKMHSFLCLADYSKVGIDLRLLLGQFIVAESQESV